MASGRKWTLSGTLFRVVEQSPVDTRPRRIFYANRSRGTFTNRVQRRRRVCWSRKSAAETMWPGTGNTSRNVLRVFRQKGYRRRSADRIFVVRPRTVFASVAVESPPSIGGVIRTPNRRDNPRSVFRIRGFSFATIGDPRSLKRYGVREGVGLISSARVRHGRIMNRAAVVRPRGKRAAVRCWSRLPFYDNRYGRYSKRLRETSRKVY